MFGVRLRSLFTSRWMALLWAVLVILTAIQFVGSGDNSAGTGAADQGSAAGDDSLTPAQQKAIANVF